jgi:exonuclease SbcC
LDRETERDSLKAKLAEVNNVLLDQVKKQTVVNKLTLEIDSLTSKRAAIRSNLDKARKELDNNIAPTDEEVAKLQAEADMVGVYEQRKEDKEAELATAERIVAENKLAISKASSEESSIKQNISLRQEMLSKCIKDSEKLKEVPCGGEGEFSLCPLIKNSVDNKNLLPSMESHLVELSQRLLDAQVYTKTLAPVDNSSSHLKLDILDLKQRIEVARKARMDISIYKSKKNDSTILKQRIDDLSTQLLELIENIQGKEEEREDLLKQLSCAMDEEYTTLTKNVVSIDNDIAYYKSAQHQVMMDLGKVDAIKKNVESAQSETRKIEKELEHLRKEKGEWSHISYAFGPKAIQALEIDSAGPWVSDLVNDLLRSCFGTRFTINLITQAMKANKSGMKDFFDIEVIDAEKSRTGLINDLSGGEKVICSEAISLAIALYNGNVGGVKWDTLYRDECSGALSPKNALLYIKMLRRAIELGKFKRCFFIAHQPELVDASDNQIIIKKGKIELK